MWLSMSYRNKQSSARQHVAPKKLNVPLSINAGIRDVQATCDMDNMAYYSFVATAVYNFHTSQIV